MAELPVELNPPPLPESEHGFFDSYVSSLKQNQLFFAGTGLAGLGLAAQLGRRLAIVGNAVLRRKFISKLTMTNADPVYPVLLNFIYSRGRPPSQMVNSRLSVSAGGKPTATFMKSPGHGTYFFTYNYRWIQVERQMEQHQIQQDGVRQPLETITLTKFGTDESFWDKMLNEATTKAFSQVESGIALYKPVGFEWRRKALADKRSLESVVLEPGVAKRICDDFQKFLDKKQWYQDQGFPHRRGYLLYGPPGTGKTSFVRALATHFDFSLCTISMSDRLLDDDRFCGLLEDAPPNSIILLEDIDCCVAPREMLDNSQFKAYEGLTRVTMSGLLNSIDGAATSKQRIIFMTTNYKERLDSALVRPGRVDVEQYLGNCTPPMLESLFRFFYKDVSEELVQKFRDSVDGVAVSPAAVRGHLMNYDESPEDAVAKIDELLRTAAPH